MAAPPMEKDVSDQLLRQRKVRRKVGEVPYPLQYTMEMLNFDIWDHMFLTSCCRKLTMHQFDVPPPMVLDLGCGGGYWAMEAARQWLDSTIIGFDYYRVQPNLSVLPSHRDLARRVKWVHGNLLDSLPFPPSHFDFVRVAGIGLGVPEDEWQFVLEDIARVMKPGGVLEIIEEDLIFPCAQPSKPRLPPISFDFFPGNPITPNPYSARSSTTLLSDPWSVNVDDQSHADGSIKKQASLSTLHESPISTSPRSPFSPNPSFSFPLPDDPAPLEGDPHPQDHTRLKTAWEAMLSRRFLSSQLITVLPFYLSSYFVDVQTHPSLSIPLPPNSQSTLRKNSLGRTSTHDSITAGDRFDPDNAFELQPSSKRRSGEGDNTSNNTTKKSSQRTVPSWAPMHLARTVNTIVGCKEAIWEEYDQLYRDKPSSTPILKTFRPKRSLTSPNGTLNPIHLEIANPCAREEFDKAWVNWENDMKDRSGMRGRIIFQCAWPEPEGDRPDWRVWRDNLETKISPRVPSVKGSLNETPELCRSMRGFVAWKPSS